MEMLSKPMGFFLFDWEVLLFSTWVKFNTLAHISPLGGKQPQETSTQAINQVDVFVFNSSLCHGLRFGAHRCTRRLASQRRLPSWFGGMARAAVF